MVSASSSACVGCSCLPSPPLMTAQFTFSARRLTAPDPGCRTTMASGCMAFSVIAVSITVSPLRTEEVGTDHVDDVGAQPLARHLERGAAYGSNSRRTG